MMNVFDPIEHVKNHPDRFVPDSTVAFIGGTYIKKFELKANTAIVQHKHTYDHASILAVGRVRIRIDNVWHYREAPAVISIAAGEEHLVVAETDVVWFCIHAVDEATDAYKNQDPHATDGLIIVKEK